VTYRTLEADPGATPAPIYHHPGRQGAIEFPCRSASRVTPLVQRDTRVALFAARWTIPPRSQPSHNTLVSAAGHLGRGGWHCEAERRPLSQDALDANLTAVRLYDCLGNGESESYALMGFCRRQKRSNTCGRSAGSIPVPLSLTANSTSGSRCVAAIITRPRRAVNFSALPPRFENTCSTRSRSAETFGKAGSTVTKSEICLDSASGRRRSTASATTVSTGSTVRTTGSVPASAVEISRRSATRRCMRRAERSITCNCVRLKPVG
jgi:hypothetical protein